MRACIVNSGDFYSERTFAVAGRRDTGIVSWPLVNWEDSLAVDGSCRWDHAKSLGAIKMIQPTCAWAGDYTKIPPEEKLQDMDESQRNSWCMQFPGALQAYYFVGTSKPSHGSKRGRHKRWQANIAVKRSGEILEWQQEWCAQDDRATKKPWAWKREDLSDMD